MIESLCFISEAASIIILQRTLIAPNKTAYLANCWQLLQYTCLFEIPSTFDGFVTHLILTLGIRGMIPVVFVFRFCYFWRVHSLVIDTRSWWNDFFRMGELSWTKYQDMSRGVFTWGVGWVGKEEGRGKEKKVKLGRYRWRCRKYRVTLKEVDDSEQEQKGRNLIPGPRRQPAFKNLHNWTRPGDRDGTPGWAENRKRRKEDFCCHLRKDYNQLLTEISCVNFTGQFELLES